jgi:hypothetical protein
VVVQWVVADKTGADKTGATGVAMAATALLYCGCCLFMQRLLARAGDRTAQRCPLAGTVAQWAVHSQRSVDTFFDIMPINLE